MHKYKFDNRVNVIGPSGQAQHPTYLHRAKGSVLNWTKPPADCTIPVLNARYILASPH